MNRQDMLNRVWDYYFVQDHGSAVSVSPHPTHPSVQCLYFNQADGCRCAIGCLLTPEQARTLPFGGIAEILNNNEDDPDVEHAAQDLVKWLDIDLGEDEDLSFLEELQGCHDNSATRHTEDHRGLVRTDKAEFHRGLRTNLSELAMNYGLTLPISPEVTQ